ncbi:MAG: hypothetical protein K2X67_03505 [Burkholderiales bacterium]|jgi:hypothetical protein|nr:hypothetical protein [Burkholderiales bacterium]
MTVPDPEFLRSVAADHPDDKVRAEAERRLRELAPPVAPLLFVRLKTDPPKPKSWLVGWAPGRRILVSDEQDDDLLRAWWAVALPGSWVQINGGTDDGRIKAVQRLRRRVWELVEHVGERELAVALRQGLKAPRSGLLTYRPRCDAFPILLGLPQMSTAD